MSVFRRGAALAAALLLIVGVAIAGGSPAGAAAGPYCGQRWGSLDKTSDVSAMAAVTNVRSGRHACFDRLVIDLEGDVVGYHVAYVPEVTMDGSGFAVPLRGNGDIQVIVRAPAYDEDGATYSFANRDELVNVAGYSTFRQVAWAGSFEGQTTIGLGVRARLPFRVFTLDGPGDGSRLVIDVGHRW